MVGLLVNMKATKMANVSSPIAARSLRSLFTRLAVACTVHAVIAAVVRQAG